MVDFWMTVCLYKAVIYWSRQGEQRAKKHYHQLHRGHHKQLHW